jgi:5-methylcytosine-specific restriction protein A
VKFCLYPGCTNRVERGYCDDHARPAEQARRGSSNDRGYGWRWRKRARAFLVEHPLCGQRAGSLAPVMSQCFDERRVTAAVQVDHVEPHRGDQALFWDETNWQALCRPCGARKSAAGL